MARNDDVLPSNAIVDLARGNITLSQYRQLSETELLPNVRSLLQSGIDHSGLVRSLEQICDFDSSGFMHHVNISYISLILIFQYADFPDDISRGKIVHLLKTHQDAFLCISRLFDIGPDIISQNIVFHDFGTTSIVLRNKSEKYGDTALKLLKPRYWSHSNIVHQVSHPSLSSDAPGLYCALVHASLNYWQCQQFVIGETLERWAAREGSQDTAIYLRLVESVSIKIITALGALHVLNPPMPHLDLNPKNIIVREDHDGSFAVTLVDFGINYAITENVGRPGQYSSIFNSISIFVAPEIFLDGERDVALADIYSYGMILLYLLRRGNLSAGNREEALSSLWMMSPELAALVEDVIEESPSRRLAAEDAAPHLLFARLKSSVTRAFDQHLSSRAHFEERTRAVNSPLAALSLLPFLFGTGQLPLQDQMGTTPLLSGKHQRYLIVLSIMCQLSYYFILISAALLSFVDYARSYPNPALIEVMKVLNGAIGLGAVISLYDHVAVGGVTYATFLSNVPGRIVCTTFAFIGTNYYIRVFSRLFFRKEKDTLANITEIMRAANAVSFLVPILLTLYVSPPWWPFCVFAGVIPVVANNFLTYRLAARVTTATEGAFSARLTAENRATLSGYELWWSQMLYYAVGCLVVGVFLVGVTVGGVRLVLHDELAYAVIAVGINYLQIHRTVVVGDGAKVSSLLSRISHWNSRAKTD